MVLVYGRLKVFLCIRVRPCAIISILPDIMYGYRSTLQYQTKIRHECILTLIKVWNIRYEWLTMGNIHLGFLLLLLLFSDVRWVPFHDYPSQNDALIYDTDGNRVGRHNTEIGYVIGKIDKTVINFMPRTEELSTNQKIGTNIRYRAHVLSSDRVFHSSITHWICLLHKECVLESGHVCKITVLWSVWYNSWLNPELCK